MCVCIHAEGGCDMSVRVTRGGQRKPERGDEWTHAGTERRMRESEGVREGRSDVPVGMCERCPGASGSVVHPADALQLSDLIYLPAPLPYLCEIVLTAGLFASENLNLELLMHKTLLSPLLLTVCSVIKQNRSTEITQTDLHDV